MEFTGFKTVFIAIVMVLTACFYIAMSRSMTVVFNIPVGFLAVNTTAVLIQGLYIVREHEYTFPLLKRLAWKICLCSSENVVSPVVDQRLEMMEDDGGIFTG